MKSNKLQFNKTFLRDIKLDENKLYYKMSIYNYLINRYNLIYRAMYITESHELYKYKINNYNNYIYSDTITQIINRQVINK